jgi:hypothetical protein
MTTEAQILIPESIKENIFAYRFKNFLQSAGKRYSGTLEQLKERVEANLGDEDFRLRFLEFLKNELSNGKNRQIYISKFEISNLHVLRNVNSVQSNLAASGLPFENFNNLLKDDLEHEELVLLNVEADNEYPNKVKKIEMCFYKEIQPSEDFKKDKFTDYVWVEINPENQTILIKIRPHTQQYLKNFHTSKKTYEEIFEKLKETFPLTMIDMRYAKEVFYTIFKELTEIAEQPYREVIDPFTDLINNFQNELLPQVGITKPEDISVIATRYKRLLERSLIINDIDNYLGYHTSRKGIVERIALTDLSGASANVLSGDQDGLDVANIYFDIRETIDEMKKLDKLWVKWFLYEENISDEQIELFDGEELEEEESQPVYEDGNTIVARFEVTKEYIIINFMKKLWVSKEVQDYVLSTFNEFEEKTN